MLVLAGDIGGTKSNVGLFDTATPSPDGRAAPALVRRATYASAEHDGPVEIIDRFLQDLGDARMPGTIGAVCLGVAGAVTDGRAESPNLAWTVDRDEVAARLKVGRVIVINDLVATALGIPALTDVELHTIQPGALKSPPQSEMGMVLAAGSGLGVALLIPEGGEWAPAASEGGHATFAPRDESEIGLLRFLARRFPDHVSVERAVSGPGLLAIYHYLLESGTTQAHPDVRDALEHRPDEATRLISENGLAGRCPVCARALEIFVGLYGSVAGDVALMAFASGGAFLGGGIAPKILPRLTDGTFTEAFVGKGRFRSFLERVPVRVILNPEAAMLGAARRAARQ